MIPFLTMASAGVIFQNELADLDIVSGSIPPKRIVISPAVILCVWHQISHRHLRKIFWKKNISLKLDIQVIVSKIVLLKIFFLNSSLARKIMKAMHCNKWLIIKIIGEHSLCLFYDIFKELLTAMWVCTLYNCIFINLS